MVGFGAAFTSNRTHSLSHTHTPSWIIFKRRKKVFIRPYICWPTRYVLIESTDVSQTAHIRLLKRAKRRRRKKMCVAIPALVFIPHYVTFLSRDSCLMLLLLVFFPKFFCFVFVFFVHIVCGEPSDVSNIWVEQKKNGVMWITNRMFKLFICTTLVGTYRIGPWNLVFFRPIFFRYSAAHCPRPQFYFKTIGNHFKMASSTVELVF